MKYAYNIGNFKTHLKSCKGSPTTDKLSGAGMRTLGSMLQPKPLAPTAANDGPEVAPSQRITVLSVKPCPGFTKSDNVKIDVYLERSRAQGGGSQLVTVTTKELFGRNATYAELSDKHKMQVDTARVHDSKWHNDHAARCVYSTVCKKTVSFSLPGPCPSCLAALKLKAFRNTLSIPLPDNDKYKYNNHEYQGKSHIDLYAKCSGLHGIIEAEVSHFAPTWTQRISETNLSPINRIKNLPTFNMPKGLCQGNTRATSFLHHCSKQF